MTLQEAFDQGFEAVRSYVDASLKDIELRFDERIRALEAKEPLKGEKGQDADTDAILNAVMTAAMEKIAQMPSAKDGRDGIDGIGMSDAMIDRDGVLNIVTTSGEVKPLGVVVGKDGERGNDGADGLGFDNLDILHDGERGFTFRMVKGEVQKDFGPFIIPIPLDRGVYKQQEYAKGDLVTYGGCMWIAQRDTSDKPGENDSWRMSVKRGRDGRDADRVKS